MIIMAVFPALNASVDAVKSYWRTPLGAYWTQSTMCCRAATAGGLVSRGAKVFVTGEPLISFPPMFVNRVNQSTRNIETSPDFAIMLLPATPLRLSFFAAARYCAHVVGAFRPACLK